MSVRESGVGGKVFKASKARKVVDPEKREVRRMEAAVAKMSDMSPVALANHVTDPKDMLVRFPYPKKIFDWLDRMEYPYEWHEKEAGVEWMAQHGSLKSTGLVRRILYHVVLKDPDFMQEAQDQAALLHLERKSRAYATAVEKQAERRALWQAACGVSLMTVGGFSMDVTTPNHVKLMEAANWIRMPVRAKLELGKMQRAYLAWCAFVEVCMKITQGRMQARTLETLVQPFADVNWWM